MSTSTSRARSPWTGWVIFAGVIMIIDGCLNAIQGLVAMFKHTIYVLPDHGLLVVTNYRAWGWVLLIAGIITAAAGVGLFSGRDWARWLAIILVCINMLIQFLWFPAFALWSMFVLALNVVVLYALTIRWDEVRAQLRN